MSKDTILKDSEGNQYSFDNLATQKWLEGHEAGAAQAAGFIKQMAIDAFARDKDEDAKLLRKLSNQILTTIMPKLKRQAEEHAEKYPYEIKAK